ncbi:MAG: cation transporter [Oscillospiraceae bacterium]|nr:cation transporter [Oscillospiraceae bacterium]
MIALLSRFFLREGMSEESRRGAYGVLCGVAGIILNILLFAGKFFAGLLSNSVAITADAFNNLSDAGSSVVTLAGFRLAGQKPDAEHPYGHGRMEYIAGLVVSGVILLMAFELLKESVGKIITPEETICSPLVVAILIVSILGKCYMASYNFRIGRQIDSAALKATGTDSLSDCVSTGVVLMATLVSHFTGLHIDGYCGVAVAVLICIAGIKAAKETLDPLLGQPPEQEYLDRIERFVADFDQQILGIHDLMVHDYGPGRKVISLHAEVPAEGDILLLHDMIDNAEKALAKELGCSATIHMDPVVTDDPEVDRLREVTQQVLKQLDPELSMHDFRVVTGPTHTNLIFDIVLPFGYWLEEKEVRSRIRQAIAQELGERYFVVIQVDRLMVQR